MKPLQLTDDAIDAFVGKLVKYLENMPATFEDTGEISDEGYDWLKEFVFRELEDYSNGYVNYN